MSLHRQPFALLALAAVALPCDAERRALLIGVGEYPQSPQTRTLEGPPRDVVAVRDLRARFKAIEAKAETLVIFDACYSGESVKGIARHKLVPRYTDFGLVAKGEVRKPSSDDEFSQFDAVKVKQDVYPYNNLL